MSDAGKTPGTPRWRKVNFGAYCDGCSNVAEWALNTGHAAQFLCDKCRITHLEGALRVVTTQHQIARDVATGLSLKLTAVEAALREAEAKAALTLKYARHLDNCEVFASFMVSEGQVGFDCSCGYDALQQPKAGAS